MAGSVPESVVYQSAEQLEVELSSATNSWEGTIFVFDATAENPVPDNLTPFYRDLVEDDDTDIEDLYHNDSGLIVMANFTQKENGNLIALFPWLGVALFGKNIITINTVDKNLEELVQSQGLQFGGGFTLSPGEIPNLRYNAKGGIGVYVKHKKKIGDWVFQVFTTSMEKYIASFQRGKSRQKNLNNLFKTLPDSGFFSPKNLFDFFISDLQNRVTICRQKVMFIFFDGWWVDK